jgi:hypothetical protein
MFQRYSAGVNAYLKSVGYFGED